MERNERSAAKTSRQTRTGIVASIAGDKTASVVVTTSTKHPDYGKYVRRRTRLAVHCPQNNVGVGDQVEIVPCRRLSKKKSWRLVRVLRRSQV